MAPMLSLPILLSSLLLLLFCTSRIQAGVILPSEDLIEMEDESPTWNLAGMFKGDAEEEAFVMMDEDLTHEEPTPLEDEQLRQESMEPMAGDVSDLFDFDLF